MSPLDLTEIAGKLEQDRTVAAFMYDGHWADAHYYRMQNAIYDGDGDIASYEARQHVRHCRWIAERIKTIRQSAVSQALQEAARDIVEDEQIDNEPSVFAVADWLRARAAQGDPQETAKSVKT